MLWSSIGVKATAAFVSATMFILRLSSISTSFERLGAVCNCMADTLFADPVIDAVAVGLAHVALNAVAQARIAVGGAATAAAAVTAAISNRPCSCVRLAIPVPKAKPSASSAEIGEWFGEREDLEGTVTGMEEHSCDTDAEQLPRRCSPLNT